MGKKGDFLSMKQKIYGSFSNIADAKLAIGNIKKENFNRVGLTIIFASEERRVQDQHRYEFSNDFTLEPAPDKNSFLWPGLKEENILGLGKIQIAANYLAEQDPVPMIPDRDLGVIEA